MFNDDIFLSNGYLNIQGLDAKINDSFNAMQTYVNGLTDVSITKQLLGARLATDETGDLRRLLFLLMMIDREREKDRETVGIELSGDNSHYIKKYKTEDLRKFFICRLDNDIVDYLFTIFGLDYNSVLLNRDKGIGEMIIEGAEVPFKIY